MTPIKGGRQGDIIPDKRPKKRVPGDFWTPPGERNVVSKRHLHKTDDVHETVVKPTKNNDFCNFWPLLGRFWAALGALRPLLSALEPHLGAFGAVLAGRGSVLGLKSEFRERLSQPQAG